MPDNDPVTDAKRHLDEAIRILTLEAYCSVDGENWSPDRNMCAITVNLDRIACAIGGDNMLGRIADDALAVFIELKLARKALDNARQ